MQQQNGYPSCFHNQPHKTITVIEERLPYNADELPQLDEMGISEIPMKKILFDSLWHWVIM